MFGWYTSPDKMKLSGKDKNTKLRSFADMTDNISNNNSLSEKNNNKTTGVFHH